MPPVTATPTPAAPAAKAPAAPSPAPQTDPNPPAAGEPGKEPTDPAHIAKRFAVLAKRETQLTQDRTATKAEREAFAKEKSEFMKEVEEARSITGLKTKFKENPHELLSWAGVTFDDLVKAQLEAEKNPGDPAARAAVKKLEEELASERSAREAEAKAREDREREEKTKKDQESGLAIVDTWMGDVTGLLEKHPEKYEFSSSLKDMSLIMDVAEQLAQETGELVSPEEILEHVEQQYHDEARELLQKMWNKPKFQALIEELKSAPKKPVADTKPTDVRETKQPSPTLRNGPASAPVVTNRKGTTGSAEKLNRAASRLQFSQQ